MAKGRFYLHLTGVLLIFAVIFLFQAVWFSPDTGVSQPVGAGMGDLHRFEARLAATGGRPVAGMGDLHLFEANSLARTYSGMGDLHAFETRQSFTTLQARLNNRPDFAGMGDLHVLEQALSIPLTGKDQ
jgi:hypothetical protein